MIISALENINNSATGIAKTDQPNAESLRRAAEQFEAILLMQLTSLLNSDGDDGEEKLFGSDGGSGLAQKMFSEQLAKSMSEAGGVGLADLITEKFGGQTKSAGKRENTFSSAISAVKDIKQRSFRSDSSPISSLRDIKQRVFNADKFTSDDSIPRYNGDRTINLPSGGKLDEVEVLSRYSEESGNTMLNSNGDPIFLEFAPVVKKSVNAPVSAPESGNAPETTGLQMPVEGRISSGFGTRFHPIDKKTKFHGGIDIAVPKGTPVGAAAEGIVKFAGWKGGYGNLVIIEHPDGTQTRYGHNDKLLVAEGQKISAGEKISLSGSTGKSTGPHLHFEVRINGKPVDPQKYLSNVLP